MRCLEIEDEVALIVLKPGNPNLALVADAIGLDQIIPSFFNL